MRGRTMVWSTGAGLTPERVCGAYLLDLKGRKMVLQERIEFRHVL